MIDYQNSGSFMILLFEIQWFGSEEVVKSILKRSVVSF